MGAGLQSTQPAWMGCCRRLVLYSATKPQRLERRLAREVTEPRRRRRQFEMSDSFRLALAAWRAPCSGSSLKEDWTCWVCSESGLYRTPVTPAGPPSMLSGWQVGSGAWKLVYGRLCVFLVCACTVTCPVCSCFQNKTIQNKDQQ